MEIAIGRVYDPTDASQGFRVLVDRLWPRGLSREAAALDHWAKVIAPSTELRQWYGHQPSRWAEFQARYRLELGTPGCIKELAHLRAMAAERPVILLTATREAFSNHALVLREVLQST